MKRAIDLLAALVIGVVVLPLGLVVAAMIRLYDRDPALLRQERTGLNGIRFVMYKFRSMPVTNDVHDHSSENKCTAIGKLIRKTSIDELPQILNVFKGEMSFIGPRPWIPEYHQHMNEQQRKRNSVRPGITGRAQAYGRNALKIHDKIKQDLIYVEQVSLREDMRIIFQTLKTIFNTSVTEIEKSGIHQEIAELKAQIRDLLVPGSGHTSDAIISNEEIKPIIETRALVSIVVPVYNASKFLSETIQSVQTQTYHRWELLFVDDHSTDDSVKIIEKAQKKDKRIKLLRNSRNSGAALSRNRGIKVARGSYLAFLDADDLWEKNKLKKQLKFMEDNDCEFSFTSYEFADQKGSPNGKKVNVPATMTYKQALKNTTIWTVTVMLNMDKLKKDEVYMPNVGSEDTACWWKILKKVEYAYGLDDILSYYRRSEDTLSSNKLKAVRRTWNLYRNVEKLNLPKSLYNFSFYAINAVIRRT